MTKIDALLRTLDALVNANKSGYRCSSEIDTVIRALLDELKSPADVYVRPRDGGDVRVISTRYIDPDIAHTLRFFYGLSPSEVSQMSPQDIAKYLRHAVNLSQESVISSGTPDAIDVEQQVYRAEMKARESE